MKINFASLLISSTLFCTLGNAQTNYFPTTGNAAINLATAPVATSLNFQVHGSTDYSLTTPTTYDLFGNTIPGTTTAYGKTSRLGMTNTTSGSAQTDGILFRISALNFTLQNLENQDLRLISATSNLLLSGATGRIWLGTSTVPSTATNLAYTNITTTGDNGLYVKSSATAGKFGVSIQMTTSTNSALQVLNAGGTKNFNITGDGYVFARKYTTTLLAIPDYVFEKEYKLMPLADLATYLEKNKHLPNIPSATEFEKNGVDLGELNRLLLEKVEEAHLYILQLELRLKALEEAKK